MIVQTLKRMAWAMLLLLLQVLFFDQIHPWGYGAPLLCPLIVITLPLGTSRTAAMLWGFCTGFVADIFAGTPGISSAALTLTAFLQPILLDNLVETDNSKEEVHPSFSTLGRWKYTRLIALLLLIHHTTYFALEGFSYFFLTDIAVSMGVSYAFSLMLILLVEHVRNPKK